MFGKLFDSNEKQLKKLRPLVEEVNSLEAKFEKLSEEEVKAKTRKWQEELSGKSPDEQKEHLGKIMPETFALVREASKRTLGDRHYDVQLIAGAVLHQGKIAEQKTGEGKTLTATLPLYLNSLTGKGAHLVTPNDYLSRHGAGWMGPVYSYLGVRVGVIMDRRAFIYEPEFESSEFRDEYTIHLKEVSRQEAYKCDLTYGTNNEFGFDYLRDNMVKRFEDVVQTNKVSEWGVHNYAIVDEVDSILIDVARTPLIISMATDKPSERYHQATKIVGQLLKDTDYEIDEKDRTAMLSDLGIRRVEKMLGISNLYEQDFEMVHLIEQSLAAHTLYHKDKDYVIKDGAIVIIDPSTGRLLPTNRYSHGIHQSIEAKEGVSIQEETMSAAKISYQNYFRKYEKLAGMTGTAITEAEEFYKIYSLDVVVIPTNVPIARIDHPDVVYKTEAAKYTAVANEAEEKASKGQPVLIGTTSVEKSQLVHEQLKRRGVRHEILNAKNHEREALIIAQAGKNGSVTVATNMAGRGVDIKLGGDPSTKEETDEILFLGGLHVIGTERHTARRIDNQLRGRSGRQGEPGSTRFYLSLQDHLMRVFGGEQVERLMDRFGLDETIPLESGIVSKSIESAQKKVEGANFDRRKAVVEYDDVINVHREVIYKLRRQVLEIGTGNESARDWFITKLVGNTEFDVSKDWDPHVERLGEENWLRGVSRLSLDVIDLMWKEHLVDMENVREGIGLHGYAQKDPIVEYKREGHERFELLVQKVYLSISEWLAKASDEASQVRHTHAAPTNLQYESGQLESGISEGGGTQKGRLKVQPVRAKIKIGRNDPCPCGSGKKYKKCGMINAPEHRV